MLHAHMNLPSNSIEFVVSGLNFEERQMPIFVDLETQYIMKDTIFLHANMILFRMKMSWYLKKCIIRHYFETFAISFTESRWEFFTISKINERNRHLFLQFPCRKHVCNVLVNVVICMTITYFTANFFTVSELPSFLCWMLFIV